MKEGCGRTPEEGDSEKEEGGTFLEDADWSLALPLWAVWTLKTDAAAVVVAENVAENVAAVGEAALAGDGPAVVEMCVVQCGMVHGAGEFQESVSLVDYGHHQRAYYHQGWYLNRLSRDSKLKSAVSSLSWGI